MKIGDYITTYSNIKFYPFSPAAEDIVLEDIGHSLSLLCRANGHFRNFYSVGQHSLNCAREAAARGYSKRVQLACLLHDASEAYLSDVTRPVKKELPDYLEVEATLQAKVFEVYHLEDLTLEEIELVTEIDDHMLVREMAELLSYQLDAESHLVSEPRLDFVRMDEIREEFISLVEELQEAIYEN